MEHTLYHNGFTHIFCRAPDSLRISHRSAQSLSQHYKYLFKLSSSQIKTRLDNINFKRMDFNSYATILVVYSENPSLTMKNIGHLYGIITDIYLGRNRKSQFYGKKVEL